MFLSAPATHVNSTQHVKQSSFGSLSTILFGLVACLLPLHTVGAIENDALPTDRATPLLVGYSPSIQLSAAEIQLALKRLLTNKTVLYLAAHPDDESQGVLSWCRSELGVRTGYLSLTRGDGGQNLIGSEKGNALGVLRTEELLAARRVDGAEQFFTRALDFGYSKTVDETLEIWNRDSILADVVWVIRSFQPDIIITRFPGDGKGGHGHHTASAQLAVEGAKAAADPTMFASQLQYVPTWTVQSVLWNSWFPDNPEDPDGIKSVARIQTGMFNNLLGESYLEIAARARSQHRCQGFGASPQRGEKTEYFWQLDGARPSDPNRLFAANELPGAKSNPFGAVRQLFKRALDNFDPEQPQNSSELLLQALEELRRQPATSLNLSKQRETQRLIAAVNGMWLEARSYSEFVTPGDSLRIQVRILGRNRDAELLSNFPKGEHKISLVMNGEARELHNSSGEPQRDLTFEKTVLVPQDISYSQPYWLREPNNGAMYTVPDQQLIGRAWNMPEIYVTYQFTYGGVPLKFALPLRYRWTDPTLGERFKPLEITPRVTLNFTRPTLLFTATESRTINVRLKSYRDEVSGQVKLDLPDTWTSEPALHEYQLEKSMETIVSFELTPPRNQSGDTVFNMSAAVKINRSLFFFGQSEEVIDYEHVPRHTIFAPASVRIIRSSIRNTATNIAYIMGSGDKVPDALEQMGSTVTLLDDDMLTSQDLSRFDAIIAGIRAYNTRDHLRQVQSKLMEYVKNGGVYLVQYNTNRGTVVDEIGPYPFNLSRGRITDENAAMNILLPQHAVLNTPNALAGPDFNNWVQERGFIFCSRHG